MLIQNPPAKIAGNLWMLGTTGYPLYLYRGQRGATIFEGGIGPSAAVLRQQLGQLGVTGDDVRQLVITHAHPDHVMAIPALAALCPQAQVVASELAAKTLSVEKVVGFFCKMDDTLTNSLIELGLASDDQRREPLPQNVIPVGRTVREADAIEVDEGVAFQVLETPGHSECSLSFYEPAAKLLIISDASGYYMPEHDAWWPNYFADYGQYLSSLQRLAQIDAEVLCLSHNGALRGAAAIATYFREAIASTEAYHQRIVDETESGRAVAEIAATLGEEIHAKSKLMPLDFFQKNCGILVKQSLK